MECIREIEYNLDWLFGNLSAATSRGDPKVISKCPEDSKLKQYALGGLAAQQAQAVSSHIAICPVCRNAVGEIQRDGGSPAEAGTAQSSAPESAAAMAQTILSANAGLKQGSVPVKDSDDPHCIGSDENQRHSDEVSVHDSEFSKTLLLSNDRTTELDQLDITLATPPRQPAYSQGAKRHKMRDRFGDYELLSEIARGGMGVVYKARQLKANRIVALKMILAGNLADEEDIQRFYVEAKAAANLQHPNIVPVYDVGEHDGQHYFSMGFVEGESLADRVKRGPLPPREAAEMIKAIADGVAYAHQHGTVHRDLKPANVLIDATGQPKITDFGLAKNRQDDSGLTATGQILGTPSFMPPEQAQGDIAHVGPLADVYSLGATLYQLLTGRPPFLAASLVETLQQVLHQDPAPPRQINHAIDKDLETICLKCLQKEQSKRYESAEALIADLTRWLNGQPIAARPVGRIERTWRWCRRNRAIASLLFSVALMLLVGAIGSSIAAVNFHALAKKEGESAALAREKGQEAELRLADMFTFTGIAVAQDGDPAQAALWFAAAAERSLLDQQRLEANQVRFHTYAAAAPIAIRAFEHPGKWVTRIEFDQSGRFLMVLTLDSDLLVWDVWEGQLVDAPDRSSQASAAAWRPDGKWLAQGFDSGIEIFEVGSWNSVTKGQLPGLIECLEFSPDSRWLAIASSAGQEYSLRLWDCQNQKMLPHIILHPATIRRLVFSSQSGLLATSCADGSTKTFSIPLNSDNQDPLVAPVENVGPIYQDAPDAPVFVDDDKALVTLPASRRLSVTAFDASGGQQLATFEFQNQSDFYFDTFSASPDPRFLMTGTSRGAVIWDITKGTQVGKIMPHTNRTPAIAVHRNCKILLTGSMDRTARLWQLPSGEPISPSIAHQEEVWRVAFSPEENLFATCQRDGLVKIWRFAGGNTEDIQVPSGWNDAFLQLSNDGRFFVPSGWNSMRTSRSLRVFDSSTGDLDCAPIQAAGLLNAQAISPSGDLVMGMSSRSTDANEPAQEANMASKPGWIELWDRETGTAHCEPVETPSEPIAGAFHPTRPMAAVLCAGGQLLWLDTDSGQILRRSLYEGQFRIRFLIRGYLRFAPNGERLMTWGLGNRVVCWKEDTEEPSYSVETGNWCSDLTYSRDGKLAVLSGTDNRVRIVKTENGEDAVPPLVQPDWVFTAKFNEDETLLLTAGRDKIARIWDWRSGKLAAPEMEHPHEVLDVEFINGGKWVLTACLDGSVWFWDRHSGRQLAPPQFVSGKRSNGLLLNPRGDRAFLNSDNNVYVFDLKRFLRTASIDASARRRLGELLSGRRQLESGGVANLTSSEWQDRWRAVQSDGSLRELVDLNIAERR